MIAVVGTVAVCLCLAAATVEDIRTREVSDLVWWIMAPACLLVIPSSGSALTLWDFLECLYAIFIQEHIMSRFYGRADSHAFSCCMIFLTFAGAGLEGHIIHLSLSLFILTVCQFFAHNIDSHGKLKKSVPFVPYIFVSFVATMLYVLT